MSNVIYLDNQATTRIDPEVLKAMRPWLEEEYGNASSIHHVYGWNAEKAVLNARSIVADSIGAMAKEIVFTSGATESNNLALKGLAFSEKGKEKRHIITTRIEHKCILGAAKYLAAQGFEITYLDVDSRGLISPQSLRDALRLDTLLVSVIFANNEIGVIQNIKELSDICHANDAYFHTDAAQAFGKFSIDVNELGIDLLSISGHKIYGPKGIGVLYVRQHPHVPIQPLFHGGGQEFGMRSGTLPTHLIVGLGEAARLASQEGEIEGQRLLQMRVGIIAAIQSALPAVTINGSLENRLAGNVNLTFPNADADLLFMELGKKVAVSNGSACSGVSIEPSHVLLALGLSPDEARSSVRIGLGRFTTAEEVKIAVDHIIVSATKAGEAPQVFRLSA